MERDCGLVRPCHEAEQAVMALCKEGVKVPEGGEEWAEVCVGGGGIRGSPSLRQE